MKKRTVLLLIMCMVLAGCGKSSTESSSDEIVLAENQSLTYGQVTKINGNEITIALAKEVSASEMQSQRGNKNKGSASPSATGDANASGAPQGEIPSDMQQGGTQPTGDANQNGMPPSGDTAQGGTAPAGDSTNGGGTPPDMSSGGGPGGMSSSDTSSDSQKAPSATGSSDTSSNRQNKTDKGTSSSDDSNQNNVMYQLTGEEETLTIPVGTAVVTSLGTTTTFSRIATDDTLKLLLQKNDAGEEVIVGVWIVA